MGLEYLASDDVWPLAFRPITPCIILGQPEVNEYVPVLCMVQKEE